MRIRVRWYTSLSICGPPGIRTVKLPKYVRRGDVTLSHYLHRWLMRNVSEMARPLEWWKDD